MKILIRYTFLPLLTGLLIFIATCLIGSSSIPDMPGKIAWDKLVHFFMFFFLSMVSLVDYFRLHKGAPRFIRWIFWGFVLPVLYGGIIELLQKYFFPSRSAEWADWGADILGSLIATFVVVLLSKRKYGRKILMK